MNTITHYVQNDNLEKVKTIDIKKCVNKFNSSGYTLLHYVQSVEMAKFLIDNGAKFRLSRSKDKYNCRYPLLTRHPILSTTFLYLVDQGLPLGQNIFGFNAFFYLTYDDIPLLKFLIEHKVDINAENYGHDTPLDYFIKMNMKDNARHLEKFGAVRSKVEYDFSGTFVDSTGSFVKSKRQKTN